MSGIVAAIALGGAAGSVLRYGVNVLALKTLGSDFPWGTLGVNVIGSFAMGILIAVFAQFWQPSPEIKALLITGFLGGFTTFSSFSLDAAMLWERGTALEAGAYVAASVVLSIGALFAAMFLIRSFAP